MLRENCSGKMNGKQFRGTFKCFHVCFEFETVSENVLLQNKSLKVQFVRLGRDLERLSGDCRKVSVLLISCSEFSRASRSPHPPLALTKDQQSKPHSSYHISSG